MTFEGGGLKTSFRLLITFSISVSFKFADTHTNLNIKTYRPKSQLTEETAPYGHQAAYLDPCEDPHRPPEAAAEDSPGHWVDGGRGNVAVALQVAVSRIFKCVLGVSAVLGKVVQRQNKSY